MKLTGEASRLIQTLNRVAREHSLFFGVPFRRVPDKAWGDLTDPASFIVSSVLTLFLRPKSTAPRDQAYFATFGARLVGVAVMACVLVAPELVGLVVPDVSTGNEYAYAVTLLGGAALTMVPGRIAELRDAQRVRGSGYPKMLRRVMWGVECILIVAGLSVALSWNGGDDSVVPAIALGLAAISISDICVLWIARSIVVSESVTHALTTWADSEPK